MTALFELREKIIRIFSKYEGYIKVVLKFLLALASMMLINSRIGYMNKLDEPLIYIALSLVCCILSVNFTIVVLSAVILAHLAALSLEVCVVGGVLFAIMFLLYFRFTPKCGEYTVLTPVAYTFHVPYVMPLAVGLLEKPTSVFAALWGTVVYYFLEGIRENETVLAKMSENETIPQRVNTIVSQLVTNKEMYVMCVAFALGAFIIYFIRRLSIDHAWSLAIIVGSLIEVIAVLAGSMYCGIHFDIAILVCGVLAAALVAVIIKFFFYNLDYSRTERVQFEDDEYYYYVKAIPKIYVAEQKKKVKKINNYNADTDSESISRKELAEEMDIDEELLK